MLLTVAAPLGCRAIEPTVSLLLVAIRELLVACSGRALLIDKFPTLKLISAREGIRKEILP